MFEADRSGRLVAWFSGSFLNTGCFLEEIRGWRRFGDESERTIWLNSDQRWSGYALLYVRGFGIELLAEVHGLDTTGTKRWPNRWCGCRLASWNEQAL